MPRSFSSGSRSVSLPVSARTSHVLPWSICPAVPTVSGMICIRALSSGLMAPESPALAGSGELGRRAAEAFELLGPRCVVCPRGCKIDRRADEQGLCAIGREAVVASYFPHFGEEDCLRGR